MRLVQAVRVGAWILVGLNLLMAVGAIGIFNRMAPAIAVIIERNERSINACVDMLAIMAATGSGSAFSTQAEARFREAFARTRGNITEAEEPEILERMATALPALFHGDITARADMVADTQQLDQINREAMVRADHKAQQLGRAGAWGVVFMALAVFLAGVLFIRSLTARVVRPLEEIHAVMSAHRSGETLRRCSGADLSQDVAAVFTGINELLDQVQALHSGQAGPSGFQPAAGQPDSHPLAGAGQPRTG